MVNNIINFVESLVKNPLIEITNDSLELVNFALEENFYLRTGEMIKDQFGVSLAKDELELENFQVKWKKPDFTNSMGHVYGGFDFSIYRGLCERQDEWLKENPLNHSKDLVENLYSFNNSEVELYTPQNGRGCFYREFGKWPLDIYFFDRGIRIKMGILLEDYIQGLLDSCAVGFWQYFYVDIDELIEQNKKMILRNGTFINSPIEDKDLDSPRLKYLINELEILVTNLPILFPEKDFSYHQNRLEQIKEKAKPYLL